MNDYILIKCRLKNEAIMQHPDTRGSQQSSTVLLFFFFRFCCSSHLYVHTDCVQAGVHDLNPAVLRGQNKQCHQSLVHNKTQQQARYDGPKTRMAGARPLNYTHHTLHSLC